MASVTPHNSRRAQLARRVARCAPRATSIAGCAERLACALLGKRWRRLHSSRTPRLALECRGGFAGQRLGNGSLLPRPVQTRAGSECGR